MRKKLLLFMIPVLALVAGLESPKAANAAGRICNYYCLDPQLSCCITCYWAGGQCLCPEYCTTEPIEPSPEG